MQVPYIHIYIYVIICIYTQCIIVYMYKYIYICKYIHIINVQFHGNQLRLYYACLTYECKYLHQIVQLTCTYKFAYLSLLTCYDQQNGLPASSASIKRPSSASRVSMPEDSAWCCVKVEVLVWVQKSSNLSQLPPSTLW